MTEANGGMLSHLVLLQASCDGTTDVEVAQAAANVPIYISWNLPPVRYHPLRLSWHPEVLDPWTTWTT